MKRIVTLLLAAGLVLGAAGAGNAADVKVKGMWDFAVGWADSSFNAGDNGDNFVARQRLRTQVDFIASETLKGVVFFEIGDQNWGRANQGASLGTDGTVIEVRYSYVDWVVPNTELKVRMGLQPIAFPGYVADSSVLNHDGAGITLNYAFNENVAATFFWARLENDNDLSKDEIENNKIVKKTPGDNFRHDAFDLFGLTLPMTFDGVKVTPWGAYASIGRNALDGDRNTNHWGGAAGDQIGKLRQGMLPMGVTSFSGSDDSRGDAWWLGLTGDITVWNPFRLAFDFNYGSVDMGEGIIRGKHGDLERKGWLASLLAEYKLDSVTPGLIFWYASGDDDDPYDGSERLPSMRPAWKPTSYGFDGYYAIDPGEMFGTSAAGTWGIVAQLKDITFTEDLSHIFRVGYYRGTNDEAMVKKGFVTTPWGNTGAPFYLTEEDAAWEVNFDTTYKIYEDLTLNVALGYIYLDLDNSVWNVDENKNNFKAMVNMRYAF